MKKGDKLVRVMGDETDLSCVLTVDRVRKDKVYAVGGGGASPFPLKRENGKLIAEFTGMTFRPITLAEQLLQIAKNHFPGVETLEARNSDSLDFHSVSVWSIDGALRSAYEAGQKSVAK